MSDTAKEVDTLTLAAVGVLAYFLASQFHELVGHGTACVAIGGKITAITAMYQSCQGDFAAAALRVLRASGSVANVILGVICFGLLGFVRPGWPKFSLWFVATA